MASPVLSHIRLIKAVVLMFQVLKVPVPDMVSTTWPAVPWMGRLTPMSVDPFGVEKSPMVTGAWTLEVFQRWTFPLESALARIFPSPLKASVT